MDPKGLLTIFFVLALISIVFNYLILKWTKTMGAKNQATDGQIRWSETYKPAIGGVSFFLVFLIAYLSYLFIIQPDLDFESNKQHFGILIAVMIGFFAGLADDAYNTVPFLKLLSQISCAIVLIYTDVSIDLFHQFWLDSALTIFWVVAVMNSVNMLDNMDGITTSVSIFILLSAALMAYPLTDNNLFYTFVSGGTVAALLGFLFFNWNPSKMFMGDTGSQFLGALLAAIGISFFWNHSDTVVNIEWWHKIVLVMVAFVVPIGDSLTVTINRLKRGQSPMVGGRDHTTHHLSFAGLTDRKVALVMVAFSAVATSLIGILRYINNDFINIYFLIMGVISVVIIGFLYSTTQWKKTKKIFEEKHLKR